MFNSMLLISFRFNRNGWKYLADKQTGTVTHPIPLWKKFRVIQIYFGCLSKYRPKFKIQPAWSLCLKKKKKKKFVLKTKTNLYFVNQKTLKGKQKKWKEMKWTKVLVQLKKNHIEKFETQKLRRGTAALVLVEDTEVTNKEEGKT